MARVALDVSQHGIVLLVEVAASAASRFPQLNAVSVGLHLGRRLLLLFLRTLLSEAKGRNTEANVGHFVDQSIHSVFVLCFHCVGLFQSEGRGQADAIGED